MEKITDLFLKVYPIEGVSNQKRVLLHVVFWIVFFLGLWGIILGPTRNIYYQLTTIFYIFIADIIFFYFITYVILQSWTDDNSNKYIITILGFVILIFIVSILFYFRIKLIFDNKWYNIRNISGLDIGLSIYFKEGYWSFFKKGEVIGSTLEIFLTALPAFFIKLTRSLGKSVSEKKQIEIDYLRAQINPHFLTNTLNNIYSLTITDDKRNGDAILSLSSLLDYVLYESNEQTISLEREISFLTNFIELEKIRNTKRLKVDFVVEGEIHGNIPPMILVTFVENAFKHSIVDLKSRCFIKIHLKVVDDSLSFEVVNSKSNIVSINRKTTFGGIGLSNTKKRLITLYPNAHSLEIKDEKDTYSINLKIVLS
ncbi:MULTISPECIES: histidine kinase [unclassified Arcicella]|uniref:sensor histidine kinase n=1 Tax=unclassified Arcicella TaxID=2644986 RepID=UPI0028555FA0|nr:MULTISPECIES: histidine kinase [unclassified Arcicella]MDR6560671.1 sensor histidine kinase YesM [Arcicella sp. BE51]MDR6810555.1 sensor histidine kinase YesM [Arcicella sp. BE140]MDR6821905.1 sensor histidine kinase YesM [Arcicella sp. BE139]